MDRSRAPYAPQDLQQLQTVLSGMKNSSKQNSGIRFRSKTYNISDGSGRTVDSWSLNEWDYKKSSLPTYARGLFTHSNNGRPEIAVRGYDKFYNVGEVRQTEWANVERNTRGPYELSVKENGCIIFIGGLDDNTLLVTSKHSTGIRGDDSANHALCGEKWIDRQLTALGKTRADLAKRLRSMNATAVAELCDDDFEEHVLQYKPEDAGLYLHGINLNLPDFATYPGPLIHQFSDEWGFRRVMYVVEDDINTVKQFLDGVAETGNYNGRDTEGFVIRCQARDGPGSPWYDWFFKYKFEEPYLMYRQWREVTKALIAGKPPKFRKHQQITQEYMTFARQQLAKNPQIGKDFNKNHGIIAMRDGFLAHKGMKGSDIIHQEEQHRHGAPDVTNNVVLIPIATIGCGKTTVAVTLTKLFGWGHVQNDNIIGPKGRPQRFAAACTNAMAAHDVLISDRNNHQRREREQITKDIRQIVPQAKLVALHWVHDRGNYGEIKRVVRDRVLSRGDNHQTIQSGSKGQAEILGIMDGFLVRFEPCDPERSPDDVFDLVIDLDVAAESIDNVATVIDKLHAEYPKLFKKPAEADVESAINSALNEYKPDVKHDLSVGGGGGNSKKQAKQQAKEVKKQEKQQQTQANKKPPRLEYFGIFLSPPRVAAIVQAIFNGEPATVSRFYQQLVAMRRIQLEFHVTLMHRASVSGNEAYWQRLNELWETKQREAANSANPLDANTSNGSPAAIVDPKPDLTLASTRVEFVRVVWDDRVMCILARLPDAQENGLTTTNDMAHITVGTANPDIKPFESNSLLKRYSQGDAGIQSLAVRGHVVLDGSVRGILSR